MTETESKLSVGLLLGSEFSFKFLSGSGAAISGRTPKTSSPLAGRKARVISPAEAVWKQFKQPCTGRIETPGWIDDDRIQVDVNPFVDTDEEGVRSSIPSCVKGPVKFSFDVDTGSLHMLTSAGSK